MYQMRDVVMSPEYNWTIRPVAQLVKVDTRSPHYPVTGRFCSGFNINDEGLFATAGHCLSEGDTCSSLARLHDTAGYRVSFDYETGKSEHLFPINSVLDTGSCVSTWVGPESVDFAILQLPKEAGMFGSLMPLIGAKLNIGGGVIAVSHPNGERKKISTGVIQETDASLINHTAYIEPGSSGSPLSAPVDSNDGKTYPIALGINVKVSTTGGVVDHKNHYAVNMSAIAARSRYVRRAGYSYSSGFFAPARDPEAVNLTENTISNRNTASSNCC